MSTVTIKVISVLEEQGRTWRVQGDDDLLGAGLSKDAALELGRRAAKERGAQLVAQREDGNTEFVEEYEYGAAEPEPPSWGGAGRVRAVSVIRGTDGWLVEGDAPDEILGTFLQRDQALDAARRAAKERVAQLIVHTEDGRFDWAEDYACGEFER